MDVGGDVIAVNIPLGVYGTEEALFSALQEAGRDQHPKLLQFFGVKYDRAQPFVSRASTTRVVDSVTLFGSSGFLSRM